MPSAPAPERLAEAARLLALHRGDAAQAYATLSQQLQVLQGRSQVLLTLATLTLTITGFSGPAMVRSGAFARGAMVAGLACVLAAVVVLLAGLQVRWLSQLDAGSPEATLAQAIAWRDRKTARFRVELALLAFGLSCYVAAVIAYLLVA